MSLPAISLTTLPALSHLAGQALRTSAAAGGQFLELLSSVGQNEPADSEGSSLSASHAQAASQGIDPLPERTGAWGQKFWNWLREQGISSAPAESNSDFSVRLSLDQFDQPQAIFSGPSAAAATEALRRDPTWLQEFRELALDRAAALGSFVSSSTSTMTLSLNSQSDTMTPTVAWT